MPRAELPREVLIWLQGLDLSYAVRSVRRDFANGFLVAEIFSRYFPQTINMNSFQNGSGKHCKRTNWFRLELLFKKLSFSFDKELVNRVIHSEPGASVVLLEFLYECLSGRKVKHQISSATKEDTPSPAYARDTASNAIRNHLRQPEMQAISDQRKRESKTLEVLDSHNVNLRSIRLASMSLRSQKAAGKGKPKVGPVTSEFLPVESCSRKSRVVESKSNLEPQITVQEVHVKQITRNIANIRATKALNAIPQSLRSAKTTGLSINEGSKCEDVVSSSIILEILSLFNSSVMKIVSSDSQNSYRYTQLFKQETKTQPIFRLVQLLQKQEWTGETLLSDEFTSDIFKETASRLSEAASTFKVNENVFWFLASVMIPVIHSIPEATDTFESCKVAFATFGLNAVKSNPEESTRLILQVGLPKLVQLLKSSPGKRHGILHILYSFVPVDAVSHISVIKRLHESLNDPSYFLHCLTILIFMEQGFEYDADDTLLDLYVYYALIGMKTSSPTVRAASIAMLAVITQFNQDVVIRILPKLRQCSNDDWWEVQAQLLIVCAKLLDEVAESRQPHEDELHDIVMSILKRTASDNVIKVGLVYLGRNINSQPKFAHHYMEVLIDFTKRCYLKVAKAEEGVEMALDHLFQVSNDPEELPVASASGGVYRLNSLPTIWDNIFIAEELLRMANASEWQHLEVWHLRIFLATLQGSKFEQSSSIDSSIWLEIFKGIKDYVYLALCDEAAQPLALEILKFWSSNCESYGCDVITDPSLTGCMKLLFSGEQGSSRLCQERFVTFFQELMQQDNAVATEATNMLKAFFQRHPGHVMMCPILVELEKQI